LLTAAELLLTAPQHLELLWLFRFCSSRFGCNSSAEACARRLQALRAWVAARADPKVTLLDFDALSLAKGAPRGLSGGDWHYQCLLK
jgi:hypothetical protein